MHHFFRSEEEFITNNISRLCGFGSTSNMPNFCNPSLDDEWVDGYSTKAKGVDF